MNYIGILIFSLSYVGIALGEIPGLGLDRSGVAILGGMLMVVARVVSVPEATGAIDYGTLILLFGLMLLSAQFRLGGFYTFLARRAAQGQTSPHRFMAFVIAASAVLSALLCNDVICLVLTPLILEIVQIRRWNPLPFLLALAAASNVGSAATIIGNPQNMFIGQTARLDFARFLLWCGPPSLLSLVLLYAWSLWKGGLHVAGQAETPASESANLELRSGQPWDSYQSGKAICITAAIIVLFFTPVPREVTVLGAASILLMSRKLTTSQFLGLVDWPLLILFVGLFVLLRGFRASGGLEALMGFFSDRGVDLFQPGLFGAVSIVLSNLVSNVPAVMLLMAQWPQERPDLAYLLALTSTYAGNLILIGSIANLIVAEQARRLGAEITFRAHAAWTAPFAILTFLIAYGWWMLMSLWGAG
ncbi:MAG: anion transporter [Planctomycetes bacterium]|nr:anion transporter [Planctomycetota bacterium]